MEGPKVLLSVSLCMIVCCSYGLAQQPPQVRYVPVPYARTAYCANGEQYDPMDQICCQGVVQQLTGPPHVSVCCNGDVINNLTEKCCRGHERARADQACCGPEAYDLFSGELCCGSRYIYEPGFDICCHGYVAPAENHICCEKGPVKVAQGAQASSTCCGCGAVNSQTEMCCGGQPISTSSSTEACCNGDTVYNPTKQVCCSEGGSMTVLQGDTCKPDRQTASANANTRINLNPLGRRRK
eukprot:scpid78527/ scgid26720/ 